MSRVPIGRDMLKEKQGIRAWYNAIAETFVRRYGVPLPNIGGEHQQ